MNNNNWRRNNFASKVVRCSCGSNAKLRSRRNFPFGRNSGAVNMKFYKCSSCGKEKVFGK